MAAPLDTNGNAVVAGQQYVLVLTARHVDAANTLAQLVAQGFAKRIGTGEALKLSDIGGGGGGGVTDHGALTGLADDDHTQYSRVDGTRAFTAEVQGVAPTNPGGLVTKGHLDGITALIISILTAPSYVTLANDAYLANERALAAGAGITLTDGGAGGNVTLAAKAVQTAGAAFGDAVNTASVAAGTTCYVRVPYAGAIAEWHIVASGSCSATIDIWKAAGALPTVANTITASAKPALSSQATASSSTLTGWTTSVAVGDVLAFHLEALTGSVNSIAISLKIQP